MTDNKLATIQSDLTITNLGQIFAQSGYFQDARQAAQAVVKILAGQELGLPPIASMTGINIIKGKVSLSAVAMATVLKRHKGYDYKVLENSENAVEIEYFYEKESIGKSKFTLEDAKRAGLFSKQPNYKKYPRNMLFARAMSNGIRWYCPDVLGGPAYTPGELETEIAQVSDDREPDGEIIEVQAETLMIDDQINEFANWLEEETKRQKEYSEAKEHINKLAENHDGLPAPIIASEILAEVQEKYPEYNQVQITEMIGD